MAAALTAPALDDRWSEAIIDGKDCCPRIAPDKAGRPRPRPAGSMALPNPGIIAALPPVRHPSTFSEVVRADRPIIPGLGGATRVPEVMPLADRANVA